MGDAALLRLAGRQHGLVTASQLLSLGFTKDAILRCTGFAASGVKSQR